MSLLLFNWVGYQVFYACLQNGLERHIESSIDRGHYEEQDLVTIKVPLHLPYFSDQQDFQREYGNITIGGVPYQYVKRKVYHDSLILVCLPDKEKLQLKAARDNYFKSVADIQANHSHKSKQASSILKNLLSDFNVGTQSWLLSVPGKGTAHPGRAHQKRYSFLFTSRTEQPPDA